MTPRLSPKSLLTILCIISWTYISAQTDLWFKVSDEALSNAPYQRQILPDIYHTFDLDLNSLSKQLQDSPERFSDAARTEAQLPIVEIPNADGQLQSYRFVKSSVMHPDLSAKYPAINTYIGVCVDNPSQIIHCGVSHKGFHGMIKSPDQSTAYIDIYASGMTDKYVVYSRKDYQRTQQFTCLVEDEIKKVNRNLEAPSRIAGDCQLRIYDLALACTGEYAQFHGGTVEDVMAEFVISMTRVNGIYETDANLTMVLIPNNDDLIFLNGTTDPYTNNNGGAMLNENQNTIDDIIGIDNYHIGHVFSTGGGGIAQLRAPCGEGKARGVTGLGNPTGDPFWVDYVAHEIGHQFGGNHTQNNNCNRAGNAAVEPGSASTIMGYAGICAPNVQNNSDDHFHAYNLAEIADFLSGNGGTCPELAPNGNIAPEIVVAADSYIVPVGTSLRLTATATDQDEDNALTYCWEQMDSEVANMPPQPTNTAGPAFRSISPTTSPTRYLPNIDAIIAGVTPDWEVLPSVTREMDWRCTVRDNNIGGGCTAEADVTLTFTESAGPFLVEVPNTSDVIWRVGGIETVEWDVASTDVAPVNTPMVDILLSSDGGLTYPDVLATAIPNTGSANIQVPFVITDQARVMVAGSDNVFFDISNDNFSILEPLVATFNMIVDESIQVACAGEDVNYDITLISFLDYDEEVTFSTLGAPEAIDIQFASATTPSVGSNVLTVIGADTLEPGTYLFDIVGESIDTLMTSPVELIVRQPILPTELTQPVDGATQLANGGLTLEWNIGGGEDEFLVELSTDPGFSNIVATTTTPENLFDLEILSSGTVYYWRVKGINQCEDGEFGPTYAFQTSVMDICETYESDDNFPIQIPPDITSTIEIVGAEIGNYIKVNIDVIHEWVGDIAGTLTAPNGDELILFDQPGIENTQFGCEFDNLLVSFFDVAENTADDFANTCEDEFPAISGDYQPVNSLSAYNNTDVNGTWAFNLNDLFPQADDGALQSWSIEICRPLETGDLVVDNQALIVPQGMSEIISQDVLETSGQANLIFYTIVSLPSKGTLQVNNIDATIGTRFTQSVLNNGLVAYIHSGIDIEGDSFSYDIVDDKSNWLQGGVQEIQILANDLSITGNVTAQISCPSGSDGEIVINIEGGNPPYTYSVDGAVVAEDIPDLSYLVNGLAAGSYEINVVDRFDYEQTITVDIEDAEPMQLNISEDFNTITANVTGGTPPYQYRINDGDLQSSPTFSNLNNATYTLVVVDNNGCEMSDQVIIDIEGLQATAALSNDLLCSDDSDAAVIIDAVDGLPPYQYRIVGRPWQDSNLFEGLQAGNYTFRVRDSQGTLINLPFIINQPDPIILDIDMGINSFTINASGGTGDLISLLDGNVLLDNVVTDLVNGDYTLTVIDDNQCEVTEVITIAIDDLTLDVDVVSGIECFGDATAGVMLMANGGVPPYRYRIVGEAIQDSPVFADLRARIYTFRVIDARGETTDVSYTITQPDIITGDLIIVNNMITVSANGGTGSLTYQIDGRPPQSDNTFDNLDNGIYAIRITDQLGCTVTIEAVIAVPELLGEVSALSAISCTDDTDGSLTLSAISGIPPYTYSIDGVNYQDSAIFSGLGAGNYQPTIRDSIGQVTELDIVTLANPELIVVTVTPFGQTIEVSATGGTAPYNYSVGGSDFQADGGFTGLVNGDYEILVVDSNGCESSLDYQLNSLQSFDINVSPISCAGELDGDLTIIDVVGGMMPYTYSINGVIYVPQATFDGLDADTYEVTVQDASGYSIGPLTVELTDPPVLTLDFSTSSGSIDLIGTGGTGDLQYSLDGGETFQDSPTFTGVLNDNYLAVVMDANGCTTEVAIMLSNTDDVNDRWEFGINPNPSNGHISLHLDSDSSGQFRVNITNALGQIVYDDIIEDQSDIHTLNLNYLPNGQYQLMVTNGQKSGVKKFVIQH